MFTIAGTFLHRPPPNASRTMDFRILNTSKQTACDCCGKIDLALTIELKVRDAVGTPICTVRYGTTCAAKASGMLREDGIRVGSGVSIEKAAWSYAVARSSWDAKTVPGPFPGGARRKVKL